MKYLSAFLLSLSFSLTLAAADRVPFALYSVAAKEGAGTRGYMFTQAVTGVQKTGHYIDRPVVTVSGIDRLSITSIEMAAAPFSAFSFRFTKDAATKLQSAMATGGATEFAVFIDGHCYSTVDVDTLKKIIAGNRVLNITVRGPYDDATHHLMELVVEKLTPKLQKP